MIYFQLICWPHQTMNPLLSNKHSCTLCSTATTLYQRRPTSAPKMSSSDEGTLLATCDSPTHLDDPAFVLTVLRFWGGRKWPDKELRDEERNMWNHSVSLHSHLYVLHLRVKLPSGDANDRGGCYHISPSDICTRTHTCRDSATSCGGVHVFTSCSIALFISQSSCHGSSPFSLSVSPFLSPCNLTRSTLVSCLLANTDCSRPGLDFPVLSSPLFGFIFQSISTPTPHSLTLRFSPPPYPLFAGLISKNMCVFRKHTSLMFALLSLLKYQAVFLFPTSDWFIFLLLFSHCHCGTWQVWCTFHSRLSKSTKNISVQVHGEIIFVSEYWIIRLIFSVFPCKRRKRNQILFKTVYLCYWNLVINMRTCHNHNTLSVQVLLKVKTHFCSDLTFILGNYLKTHLSRLENDKQ